MSNDMASVPHPRIKVQSLSEMLTCREIQ